MRTITIIAEQVSETALAAAIPATGVASVTVSPAAAGDSDVVANGTYRSFRNPARFIGNYRIDVAVEDDAVDAVFDGIAVAYGAGFFSDAEMWVSGQSGSAERAAVAA